MGSISKTLWALAMFAFSSSALAGQRLTCVLNDDYENAFEVNLKYGEVTTDLNDIKVSNNFLYDDAGINYWVRVTLLFEEIVATEVLTSGSGEENYIPTPQRDIKVTCSGARK